ncbi:2',3'-cyclic-nucleotide 3'-phosphodiesterase [Mycena polygramma]|nr:2',3'-cyclic-nucleotide 3'-phosphodiesterase [Mycena polygramma]
MGLTLWIVPSAADSDRLKIIMDVRPNGKSQLSSESSYPKFHPHITLASIPDPAPSLETILSSIPDARLPISFASVEIGDHYFRSVYLAVHATPALLDLHHHVHAKLAIPAKTPKYPHISLCYINDNDAAAGERTSYFQELEKRGRVRQGDASVSLNCGEAGEEDWINGFESPEIWIARCEGPVETWTVEKKIALH